MTTRYKRKFEVPNLDAMSIPDLIEFQKLADATDGRTAKIASKYAKTKVSAMRARERGAIDMAIDGYERACDRLYEMLPKSARW